MRIPESVNVRRASLRVLEQALLTTNNNDKPTFQTYRLQESYLLGVLYKVHVTFLRIPSQFLIS